MLRAWLAVLSLTSAAIGARVTANTFETVLNRAKRQMDGCMMSCMMTMGSDMERTMEMHGLNMEDLQSSQGFYAADGMDESVLRSVCDIYKEGRSCMGYCPSGRMQDTLLSAFSALDHICIHEFDTLIGLFPCFRRTRKELESKCEPQCGSKNALEQLKRKMKAKNSAGNFDTAEMMGLMGKACDMAGCQLTCSTPILSAQCPDNPEASSFLRGFLSAAMGGVEKALSHVGLNQPWPESCRRLSDASDLVAPGSSEESVEEIAREDLRDSAAQRLQSEPKAHGNFAPTVNRLSLVVVGAGLIVMAM